MRVSRRLRPLSVGGCRLPPSFPPWAPRVLHFGDLEKVRNIRVIMMAIYRRRREGQVHAWQESSREQGESQRPRL